MTFERILVATDFSDSSQQALELAVSIAEKFGSELTLVHSWEAPNYSYAVGLYVPVDVVAPIERAAVARLEEATTQLKARLPTAKSLLLNGSGQKKVNTRKQAEIAPAPSNGGPGMMLPSLPTVMKNIPIAPAPAPGQKTQQELMASMVPMSTNSGAQDDGSNWHAFSNYVSKIDLLRSYKANFHFTFRT